MKIIFFGSDSCEKCKLLKNNLNIVNISFDYIDGMDPVNDDFCDLHDVYEMPHLKIFDETNNLVWEKKIDISLAEIIEVIQCNSTKNKN